MLFRSSNQVSQCVRKLNPVLLLMIFSVLIFLVRKVFFPQYTDDMLISALQGLLAQLGLLSVVYLLLGFVVCAFFFIPVLMPLCILCGAFYGPVQGSVVALAGITLGCVATTVSVRRVFRGMGRVVMEHPEYKNLLVKLTHHGVVVVLLVRLAFVVPYILQNILLALTNISIARLTLLTLLGGFRVPSVTVFWGPAWSAWATPACMALWSWYL